MQFPRPLPQPHSAPAFALRLKDCICDPPAGCNQCRPSVLRAEKTAKLRADCPLSSEAKRKSSFYSCICLSCHDDSPLITVVVYASVAMMIPLSLLVFTKNSGDKACFSACMRKIWWRSIAAQVWHCSLRNITHEGGRLPRWTQEFAMQSVPV
jgi:hypothetical protein